MRILVACEYSGTVRDAFIRKGHQAMSCDLLPTDVPGPHYQGNVLDILNDGWDMVIAHPPCTYLCNSGCSHLYTDPSRWDKMVKGAEFFRKLLFAKIPKRVIENPILHKYAARIIGYRQYQIIQPWMFGHPEQKATGLWIHGLTRLLPTNNVYDEMMKLPNNQRQRLHHLPPSDDRWKLRSKTFQGIADAMADQWG